MYNCSVGLVLASKTEMGQRDIADIILGRAALLLSLAGGLALFLLAPQLPGARWARLLVLLPGATITALSRGRVSTPLFGVGAMLLSPALLPATFILFAPALLAVALLPSLEQCIPPLDLLYSWEVKQWQAGGRIVGKTTTHGTESWDDEDLWEDFPEPSAAAPIAPPRAAPAADAFSRSIRAFHNAGQLPGALAAAQPSAPTTAEQGQGSLSLLARSINAASVQMLERQLSGGGCGSGAGGHGAP